MPSEALALRSIPSTADTSAPLSQISPYPTTSLRYAQSFFIQNFLCSVPSH
ncbi:hypothetical protein HMPREF1992_02072 [Selenomonas sp. oral taxon 892 str. F0426]|nr:hypothetical protein HMPREF1992_02072 [Selenomonas sp. oral taxon 892 str. F0426]